MIRSQGSVKVINMLLKEQGVCLQKRLLDGYPCLCTLSHTQTRAHVLTQVYPKQPLAECFLQHLRHGKAGGVEGAWRMGRGWRMAKEVQTSPFP